MVSRGGHTDIAALVGAVALPPSVTLRAWVEDDFAAIQRLSQDEGWPTPVERPAEALAAWRRSWPALVAVTADEVIGFSRALSDGTVTTYIAELLVAPVWRRRGIASALLDVSHRLCPGTRLDLLAIGASQAFYAQAGLRPFAGFRLSWPEREARRAPQSAG